MELREASLRPGHIKGIVHEVGKNACVKVRLPEYDDLITDWLPVAQYLTFGAKSYTVPRKDTQVFIIPGYGLEDAVVGGAIFSEPDPAPFEDSMIIGIVADDGVEIGYDPKKSLLTVKSPIKIDIAATFIDIEGDCNIKGNIVHEGNLDQTGNAKISGNQEIGGNASVSENLKVNGKSTLENGAVIENINFITHKHTVGPSTSSPPIP